MKGFKKCCISNTFNGIDYDMLWNSSAEDGSVTKCEEDEGTCL